MSLSRFLLLSSASAGIGLMYLAHNHFSVIRRAQCSLWATVEHIESHPMTLLDPSGHPTQQDSSCIRIPVRKLKADLSNEEILRRFTYGYFGGWIFTPERVLLRLFRLSITKISALDDIHRNRELSLVPNNWSLSALSRTRSPPLGSLLFGNFLLLDCSAASVQERNQIYSSPVQACKPNHAFAEFIAGSDKSVFAVSQRFEVVREESGPGHETEWVIITASHILCNPLTGQRIIPDWMGLFHRIYAKLLFADGILEVLR
ncbi:hypothetical protein F5Y19DRAFT_353073 [Xylariaceae sp. FL1651]|nr:hypothetical protein F5Y19DRAFT_353073 [Xylariaceae sp. FL1651]